MTGKDLVLLISTFFMGAVAGAYLYVSAFAPSVENLLPDDELNVRSFVIEGEVYGACSETNSCASFQLIDGRVYSYLPTPDSPIIEGTLNAAYKPVLLNALSEEVLSQHAKRSAEVGCASNRGSVDYTYTISREGTEYVLDTCATLLSSNQELQNILIDVWFALENPDAEPPEIPVPDFKLENAADFIFNRFHSGTR